MSATTAFPSRFSFNAAWTPEAPGQTTLARCLVLAGLLHLLLVLWVGTLPGGGAGGSWSGPLWGEIEIQLQGRARDDPLASGNAGGAPATARRPDASSRSTPTSAPQANRATAPELAPKAEPVAGQAPQGSVLRGKESGLPAAPSLADLQAAPSESASIPVPPPWTPAAPAEPLRPERPAVLAVPVPKAPDRSAPPAPVRTVPMATPNAEREQLDAAALRPPALIEAERVVIPAAEQPTVGVQDAQRKASAAPKVAPITAPVATTPASAPVTAARPVPRVTPTPTPAADPGAPVLAREPPADAAAAALLAPPPEPAVPRAPAALQNLESQTRLGGATVGIPTPSAAVPLPPALVLPLPVPSPAPVVARPPAAVAPVPARAAAPVEPAAPPSTSAVVATPVPATVLPAAPPQTSPTTNAQVGPAAPPAPTRAVPTAPVATSPASVSPNATGGAQSSPVASPPRDASPTPRSGPGPALAAPGAAPGSSDAGARSVFNLPPPPPAAAASAPGPGRLNLELPRARGPDASPPIHSSSGSVLRLNPPPSDPRSKLSRDIENSAKEDCRKAHADKGILGAVGLVADALKKDSGCKW